MLSLLRPELDRLARVRLSLEPMREGRVCSCDGGLIEVSGQPAPVGSLCEVLAHGVSRSDSAPLKAEVIGFRAGHSLMMLLGDTVMLAPGAKIRVAGNAGMVPVGEEFLGRAVDGLGQPIDGCAPVRAARVWPLGGLRESALERSSVAEPFDTGVRAINALTTMGVGQRMGIIAGSGVGKSVLIDMIARGSDADVVIVGLIGERAREVSDFVAGHMNGARKHRTIIVAVPADHAANLRLRGAQHAAAMAEYFRKQGKRVLLIMDSLTRVAHAAREIALLLGEPGAARGYPPSALAAITRLVERAGNSQTSGGAVTGIYSVLADGDDHDDPVVDTARAILDGHIVLSRDLAQRGQYPAIDVPASLSRVMDGLVTARQRDLARQFRALAADYESNRDLVLMGAYRQGADAAVDQAMALHPALAAFVAQTREEPVPLGESFAALHDLLQTPDAGAGET